MKLLYFKLTVNLTRGSDYGDLMLKEEYQAHFNMQYMPFNELCTNIKINRYMPINRGEK